MKHNSSLRERLYVIIFKTNTPGAKLFDIILLIFILISVAGVMLESVPSILSKYGKVFDWLEIIMGVIFTLEYLTRLWVAKNRKRYVFSFFGIIDLLAILPTYIMLIFSLGNSLVIIRILRLLRVFRILKLVQFIDEASDLMGALYRSKQKITVFIFAVTIITVILGTVMYMVEGQQNGFTSIPRSIYWAIVTLTTVGYGDISPVTPLGQTIASVIMILGYGIIAIPTGIVTSEMSNGGGQQKNVPIQRCGECGQKVMNSEAKYCDQCGTNLSDTLL